MGAPGAVRAVDGASIASFKAALGVNQVSFTPVWYRMTTSVLTSKDLWRTGNSAIRAGRYVVATGYDSS